MIPGEAVEAARDAVREAMIKYGPDGHTDGDEEITRAALEAALPHLAVLREAKREELAAAWWLGQADLTHDLFRDQKLRREGGGLKPEDATPNPYKKDEDAL